MSWLGGKSGWRVAASQLLAVNIWKRHSDAQTKSSHSVKVASAYATACHHKYPKASESPAPSPPLSPDLTEAEYSPCINKLFPHTHTHTHSKWRHFSPCLMEPQRANRDNHLPSNQQQQQQWQRQQQQHRLRPEDRVAWRASRHKRDGVTESKQKHERTPMISSLPLSLPLCFAPECHFTITIRDPFSYPLLVGFSGRKLSLGPD